MNPIDLLRELAYDAGEKTGPYTHCYPGDHLFDISNIGKYFRDCTYCGAPVNADIICRREAAQFSSYRWLSPVPSDYREELEYHTKDCAWAKSIKYLASLEKGAT